MMITKGLYIHIPYCIKKCNYCDFCSVGLGNVADEYLSRLLNEAERYRRKERIKIDTLYFGGGTPSLLTPSQLSRIKATLDSIFDFTADCEFTLEANPGTVTEEKIRSFRQIGVNRISMGLQSIHENELKILGRIHNYEDFLRSYEAVRTAGIENVSVDLMYGIPEQTEESFSKTLDAVRGLAVQHISAYGLIIEPATRFFDERERLALPTEDEECAMYELACKKLGSGGFSHYEISNYALEGYESRHNLKYWRDLEYIGLGASAYSYFEGKRFGNVRSVDAYIRGDGIAEAEDIDLDGERYEYAMMRLRLSEGFSLDDYASRFGVQFTLGKEALIDKYSDMGLLRISDGRISLTEKGFYLSNTILVNLL